MTTPTSEGLDPAIRTREIVFEADIPSVMPRLEVTTVLQDTVEARMLGTDTMLGMQAPLDPVPVLARAVPNRAPLPGP